MTAVFPMPPDAAPAARRAALTLYAASAADRDWLLSQLRDGERSLAQSLLQDLSALGIPRDPSMVRSALAECRPDLAVGASHSTGLDRLRRASAADLAALLEREPPVLVARVLHHLGDECRFAVMDRFAPAFRRAAEGGAAGAMTLTQLDRAALRELEALLPPASRRPLWRRLLARFTRKARPA